MKMTQIMSSLNTLKFIGKVVLLYGTILYFFCFIISAESLGEKYMFSPLIGILILFFLILMCHIALREDNLNDFIPKYFRDKE